MTYFFILLFSNTPRIFESVHIPYVTRHFLCLFQNGFIILRPKIFRCQNKKGTKKRRNKSITHVRKILIYLFFISFLDLVRTGLFMRSLTTEILTVLQGTMLKEVASFTVSFADYSEMIAVLTKQLYQG